MTLSPQVDQSQAFDISTFEPTSQGPWSALANTTLLVPEVATGSVKLDGKDVVATYSGGVLQSADAVTGPWNKETRVSPLKITPTAAAEFYRVTTN